MITDLYERNFPSIYAELITRFPAKPWIKRTQDLQHEINANPMLESILESENRIAYGLTWFDAGMERLNVTAWEFVKVAMVFTVQVNALCDVEAKRGSSSLAGRVAGAFSNPDDMRAMVIELHAAIGLHRRGFTVDWPEATEGSIETFDILANSEGPNAFEVECKSFSAEKGLKVTQLDAANFFNTLVRKLSPSLQRGEVLAASVVVPHRLPTRTEDLHRLCGQIHACIVDGGSGVEGVFELQRLPVEPFDPGEGKDRRRIAHRFFEHVRALTEKTDATSLVVTTPQRAGIFLTVESENNRRSMRRWEDTAKRAIRKQLTGHRPGCLVIRLEGMTGNQLENVCGLHHNFLSVFASDLLNNDRHKHLASIVFVSDSEWAGTRGSPQLGRSRTYVFDNPAGSYPNLGLGSYFLK